MRSTSSRKSVETWPPGCSRVPSSRPATPAAQAIRKAGTHDLLPLRQAEGKAKAAADSGLQARPPTSPVQCSGCASSRIMGYSRKCASPGSLANASAVTPVSFCTAALFRSRMAPRACPRTMVRHNTARSPADLPLRAAFDRLVDTSCIH